MTKNKRTKGGEASSTEKEEDPCYCEYYCSGGQWWPVHLNAPSGYYCPDVPVGEGDNQTRGCSSGTYSCGPAIPEARLDPKPEPAGENVCEYDYRNRSFYLTAGRCTERCYCPPDLVAYAREHGDYEDIVDCLLAHPEIVEAKVRIPAESIDECEQAHHNPGHHDAAADAVDAPRAE